MGKYFFQGMVSGIFLSFYGLVWAVMTEDKDSGDDFYTFEEIMNIRIGGGFVGLFLQIGILYLLFG